MKPPVTIAGQSYLCPSWQEMGETCLDLAKQIQKANLSFDRVVALAKGGLSWNRQLQDFLQIKHTSSIQVRLYQGIYETAKKPIVVQSLPITIENENILVFDDVADSGESLQMAVDYIQSHGPKNIHTAVLFQKPWCKFKPDFSVEKTEAWLIFPHDTIEHMANVAGKWQTNKKNQSDRFIKMGIDPQVVDFYLATQDST